MNVTINIGSEAVIELQREILREIKATHALVKQVLAIVLREEDLQIAFHVGVPTEQVGLKEKKMPNAKINMTDSQQVVLGPITYTDKRGNPTPPPSGAQPPVWSVDNTQLLTVTPTADGLSATLTAAGPLGTGTVSVKVSDASGVALASGAGDVTITGGAPTQVTIPVGTPSEQP